MASKKQKSISFNLIVNGIKTLMSVLFPLITFPYASRILGASGIGKVNYASSIISYFSLIASLGISTYAIREGARIREDREKFNKFAREILSINLCTTVISYLLLIVFLSLPILNNYKILLVICSAGIVFTTIGMEWLFIIKEEYSYITIRAIAFQFISLILLFLLVKSEKDYCWYSGGSAVMNLWHSRKFVDWRNRGSKLEFRKHLKPIFLIFGTSLASSIYMTMDTTMLGALKGDSAVGVYTAAVKINSVVSTLIGTVSSTILPRVAYYIGNGLQEQYKKLMKTSMDILLMISMPAAIGMICTSDILILLFSGKEFLVGSLAAKILSAKVVVSAINRVLAYQVCTPYKMDKEVLISTASGAIFNLFANAILIPIAGVTGASVATLFSEIIVFCVLSKYAKEVLDTRKLYDRLWLYGAISILFVFVRMIMNRLFKSSILCLGGTMSVCVALYAMILLIIGDKYIREYLEKFGTIIKKIIRK
mgnify:CR=1 FL=1